MTVPSDRRRWTHFCDRCDVAWTGDADEPCWSCNKAATDSFRTLTLPTIGNPYQMEYSGTLCPEDLWREP